MTTIEALDAAIGMLETMAGGKVCSPGECSHCLKMLKTARNEYDQRQRRDARGRTQIRALSALVRAKGC
jgi:hypothetical protein